MKLPGAWLTARRIVVAVLVLAPSAGRSRGQDEPSLKARLAAAQERHAARERLDREVERDLRGGPADARAAARARYREERRQDLGELLAQARRHPDDPAALPAIRFAITADHEGSFGVLDRAIELLARDHGRSPGVGQDCLFLSPLYYAPAVGPSLRVVLEGHPDRRDRAGACLALANMLRIKASMARHLREYPDQVQSYGDDHGAEAIVRFVRETDPDATQKEAEAAYERVVNEFGDLRPPHAPRRSLGEIAAGELNALRNLNIGQVAPDIEGADVEGKRFKLSDFRGKVVLLAFSGEWYPESGAFYARQRALLARYAGRPFAVVDVNTDPGPDKLRASVKAGRVTWRCWWDGGLDGPIATRWAIRGYPGVFLLDAKGIIRHRDVQGDGMDEAVGGLMAGAKD